MKQSPHKLKGQTAAWSRSGWSLIEMTVIISLIGAFSLVGFSLLTRLMELDTALAGSTMMQLTTDRFEDQLRTDARLVVKAEQVESGFDLTEQNGTVIEYRILADKEIVTRKIQGERRVSREAFNFLNCDLQFEVSPHQLTLLIKTTEPIELKSRSSQLSPVNNATVRMAIPLGRHIRYLNSEPPHGEES